MRVTPTHYKIAASITVLLIAAPLAYHMLERRNLETPERYAINAAKPLPQHPQVGQQLPVAPAPSGPAKEQPKEVGGRKFPAAKMIQQRLEGEVAGGSPAVSEKGDEQAPATLDERINLALKDAERDKAAPASSAPSGSPQPVRTVRVNPDGSISRKNGVNEQPAQSTVATAASTEPAAPPPASAKVAVRAISPEAQSKAKRNSALDRMVAVENKPLAVPVLKPETERLPAEVVDDTIVTPDDDQFNNKFEASAPNPVKQVAAEPVSTFSTDVDTASYAYVRRALNSGNMPPKDAVRVEEMINYFPYAYPRPDKAEAPFQPTVTVTPAPWNAAHKLVHIGIKGYELNATSRPRANLVFLIDVSGSMASADKLPLVKNAFRMLLDELQPDDTVGIVTYASGTGVALEPTRVRNKQKILDAIDRLGAGGSTAGAQGIQDAYRLAEGNFDKAAVNRIILATDGDFNVGITNQDELKGFIERKRQTGIFLSILGVGEGNYNDSLTQKLAQNGNGTAAYVDTLNEARKVLVDEASSTLFTIAKDVKIQIEFNPAQVSEYRLIGYETRALKREDFNNDKVDAGDIGSGHTVTAIYEITPVGAPKLMDDLRYGKPEEKVAAPSASGQVGEYAFLKMRYKLPNEDTSKLITQPIGKELEKPSIDAASEDVRFSVAVAAFGQMLRGLPYLQNYSYDDVIALAQGARGPDNFGYRSEFVNLVRLAKGARP